jgi:hypothetical protein
LSSAAVRNVSNIGAALEVASPFGIPVKFTLSSRQMACDSPAASSGARGGVVFLERPNFVSEGQPGGVISLAMTRDTLLFAISLVWCAVLTDAFAFVVFAH